jgi:hypothetical protein
MVRVWVGVGSLRLFFYVGFCVQPSMVLNQVSLVVSDWESYLGSLGFTVGLWVFVSMCVFVTTRYCFGCCRFHVSVYCFCSSVHLSVLKPLWTLTMLHLGPILTPLQTKKRSAVTVWERFNEGVKEHCSSAGYVMCDDYEVLYKTRQSQDGDFTMTCQGNCRLLFRWVKWNSNWNIDADCRSTTSHIAKYNINSCRIKHFLQ